MAKQKLDIREDYKTKYGFRTKTKSTFETEKGLNEKVVKEISDIKNEPDWLRQFRLRALNHFFKRPLPQWGGNLNRINFDDIVYYVKPTDQPQAKSWEELPAEIKKTFDALGIPEAERKFLAGVGAQFESENVYHSLQEKLKKQGVIFVDPDTGLREYPHIFRKYFGTVVPIEDNKFAALNSAAFSGGSFIYIPPGVHVEMPLQAYFRINRENMGQFERTLIIADEGSKVHYIEGCLIAGTPITTSNSIKPIEEIKIGEKVLTHNGRFMKVYHTQVRKYSGKLYRISYYGNSTKEIDVTKEHPFLVAKDVIENTVIAKWVPASQLNKNDKLLIPINRELEEADERQFTVLKGTGRHGFKEVKLTVTTDAPLFRLIGYYLAEGTTIGEHYVSFTFNIGERKYIEDVKYLLKRYFDVEPHEYAPYKGGISLVVSSTLLARFFKNNFGHLAEEKHLPSWIMLESLEKQKELIKGYWSGDGSFMYEYFRGIIKRMFRINTISEELVFQMQQVLLRLNIFASIHKAKRKGKRKDMYTLYIGGSFIKDFSETVDFNFGQDSDYGFYYGVKQMVVENLVSFVKIIGNYALVPIKKVESQDVENIDVYNFGVEEDESYVSNLVAVHNCTAAMYRDDKSSLHTAVVELIALKGAQLRYTTLQNWSNNVYNLVTKRSVAHEGATVEWLDANIGSRLTMKYPSVYLVGPNAKADILSVAFAGKGQHQDAGGKAIHLAPNTTSRIISKSVSKDGGRTTYRGLLQIMKGATNSKSTVRCDALLVDDISRTDTYPYNEIQEETATVTHEAAVGKIGEDLIFYLMSRGLTEQQALGLVVNGFFDIFTKELPMEYAIEFNRLIQLEMSGAVG